MIIIIISPIIILKSEKDSRNTYSWPFMIG